MPRRSTRTALAVVTQLALCGSFQLRRHARTPVTAVRSPVTLLRSGNEDGFVDEIDDGAGPDDFALAEEDDLDVGAGSGFLDAWTRLFLARDSAFLFQRPVLEELEDESLAREEDKALAACASGDRLDILAAVEALEEAKMTPDDLLDEDAGVEGLDGRWSLLATVAGRTEGDEELSTAGISNSVNASGIMVEATPDKLPVQVFDVAKGRVSNEVSVDLPVVGSAFVRVSGEFARGANGRRANVVFDNLEVFDGGGRRAAALPWVFGLVNRFKPELAAGDADTSWLETTYLSPRVRVGRGNKGSVFVLERTDDPTPLEVVAF